MIDYSHRLGRIKDEPDAQDHLLSKYVEPVRLVSLPTTVVASRAPILDQGESPQCVAYSGAGVRSVEEHRDEGRWLHFDEPSLYRDAKAIDGHPGEDGTNIRSAAKVLLDKGMTITQSADPKEIGKVRPIAHYARCLDLTSMMQAVADDHAVWIGADWLGDWFHPGTSGRLRQGTDSSMVAGGHAFYADGYNRRTERSIRSRTFGCVNSWGIGWARRGRFFLPFDEVERQLANDTLDAWVCLDVIGDR